MRGICLDNGERYIDPKIPPHPPLEKGGEGGFS